jgi:hypothetical protein
METIAQRRYGFAWLAVVTGITLSLLLLVVACGGSNGESNHLVRAGSSPAASNDGSPTEGPAAVPVNPWAVNDPATILSLCRQPSLDPAVRQAISARCGDERLATAPAARARGIE